MARRRSPEPSKAALRMRSHRDWVKTQVVYSVTGTGEGLDAPVRWRYLTDAVAADEDDRPGGDTAGPG
jgi:hypothetical protein